MLDSVDLDKLGDDVLSDKNLDDLLNISDNTDSEKSGRIAFEKSANFGTEKSTNDSLKTDDFLTGNTAQSHVDNNSGDTASKTVNCERDLTGYMSQLIDNQNIFFDKTYDSDLRRMTKIVHMNLSHCFDKARLGFLPHENDIL